MQKMTPLVDEIRLNQILMEVQTHVERLGFDNDYLNNSYNYGVNIPNIEPLNVIFKQKIDEYLKDNPDEGLQTFVDNIEDGDYIEQVLHDLACILVEYSVPPIMATEPVFEQIVILLGRNITPSEYSMTYKEMDWSAAEYFTLMYSMLLDTIREFVRQTGGRKKGKKGKKGKKRSSKRSKKGGRQNRKTRSSRKI